MPIGLHEVGHDVDGDGEDDRAVVLGRDAVQGLQVPQLGVMMVMMIMMMVMVTMKTLTMRTHQNDDY